MILSCLAGLSDFTGLYILITFYKINLLKFLPLWYALTNLWV